ncbi:MAG: DNA alkylation repair protein [Chloroflexi bacterium]|nr:DNA alkylation repair protein [Chloroflexota bacterium]
MKYEQAIARLNGMASTTFAEGMARFGINAEKALGISLYDLRKLAREIGKDHALAQQLWDSGIHEARTMASYVDDPARVTEPQMERWVRDLDSWDLCDQVSGLFAQTPFAEKKIFAWAKRDEEFVKRAAFALIAERAWHDKRAADAEFEPYLALIKEAATDERNFVRKAVNWALRNIGKRNLKSNRRAVSVAREIGRIDSRAARWIASDALRELTGEAVQARLRRVKQVVTSS